MREGFKRRGEYIKRVGESGEAMLVFSILLDSSIPFDYLYPYTDRYIYNYTHIPNVQVHNLNKYVIT